MTAFNTVTGARIGESPIIQKNTSFTRPANTTQYAIGDSVAPATVAITGATNANPSVITTGAPHGLATGDRVTIAGSGGNTAINGTFQVVVLTSTTFSLKTEAGTAVAGNGAWTAGGTVQKLLRFADVVPAAGGSGSIVAVRLIVRNGTVTSGTFRIRFFNEPVAAIADNAPYTVLTANRDKRVGYIDLPILATDGAGSDESEVSVQLDQPIPFTCSGTRTDLFAAIVALGTFTPGSGDTFKLEITVKRDQIPGATTNVPS